MWIYYVLAVLLLFMAGMTALMFRKAFYRPKVQDMSREGELEHSALFGYAPIIRPSIEWLRKREMQRVTVTAEDGTVLSACWIAGKKETAFLMLHGYASAPFNDFCLAARWAVQRGYSVLLPDERGHGQSGGSYTTLGILESSDCRLWAEKLRELAGEKAGIVLMGVGMGAAAALLSIERGLPETVMAVVADCGYTSVKEQIEYTAKNRWNLRSFPLIPLFSLYARLLWRLRLGKWDTVPVLEKNETIPVFFAHGKVDLTVPYSETEKAYQACAAKKQLFTGENAGHTACCLAETERYYTELQAFLRDAGK